MNAFPLCDNGLKSTFRLIYVHMHQYYGHMHI